MTTRDTTQSKPVTKEDVAEAIAKYMAAKDPRGLEQWAMDRIGQLPAGEASRIGQAIWQMGGRP